MYDIFLKATILVKFRNFRIVLKNLIKNIKLKKHNRSITAITDVTISITDVTTSITVMKTVNVTILNYLNDKRENNQKY